MAGSEEIWNSSENMQFFFFEGFPYLPSCQHYQHLVSGTEPGHYGELQIHNSFLNDVIELIRFNDINLFQFSKVNSTILFYKY